MDIDDGDLEDGLFAAFRQPHEEDEEDEESVLEAIDRLHGAGSSILLSDSGADDSPIVLDADVQGDRRYHVLGEIARGGIGVIYKGRDRDLNRDIALKVLRKEYAERKDVIQRFIEEAQVGGQLQHPGIVPVYGIGLQPDGRPSFAMKLIKGQTLAGLLDENPDSVDLISVFEQVAHTIAYAHSRGVIHRDLKPANIMVGAFGEVQVVDWGFAKVLGRDETERPPDRTVVATVRSGPVGSQSVAGSVMGTPAYMPPEQATGRIDELDERCDVFSLGAILCEILTGKPPYTGGPGDQLTAAMQSRLEPAYERLAAAQAADELKQLARDCLQPLKADRPKDAPALAERLSRYLVSVEENARQAELDALAAETKATREHHARRRAVGLAAAALLLVCTTGAGYLFWKSDRDAREARARQPIAAALREATRFEGGQEWTRAVAAAQRAVDLAATLGVDGSGARAILVRLEHMREAAKEDARIETEDAELLAELEAIRSRIGQGGRDPADAESTITNVRDRHRAVDAAYTNAFTKRFGSVEAARDRLKASRHAADFAGAFAFWAWVRRLQRGTVEGTDWRRLERMAREIDPDSVQVTDRLLARENDAFEKIVAERSDRMPLAQVAHVAHTLVLTQRYKQAVAFLKPQYRRAPHDFYVNMLLAAALDEIGDRDAALRHATAALARRPEQGWPLLAELLVGGGDHERGIAAAHRAVELEPKFALPRWTLGRMLAWCGDVDGAIAAFRKAVDIDPKYADAYSRLGLELAKKGEFAAAVEAHEKAIEIDPGNGRPLNHLANLYAANDDLDRAIALYREAIAIDPEDGLLYSNLSVTLRNKGDIEGALAAARKAVELEPEFGSAHNNLGSALLESGDFDGAIAAARRAVEIDPEKWSAHNTLGIVLQRRGDLPGAIAAYRHAIELAPSESAIAHLNLGTALLDVRDIDGAIAAFRRAIELRPGYDNAYQNLSYMLYDKGDLQGALAVTREWREHEPGNAKAHRAHGLILSRTGNDEAAIASYRRALELDPGNRLAYTNLSYALMSSDRPGAFAAVRRWIELAPDNADAHALLGDLYRETGEFPAAVACYRKAIELDAEHVPARYALGVVLCDHVGRPDEALPIFDRAIELDPTYDNLHQCRSVALRRQGDYEGACAALRRAIELAPKRSSHRSALGWLLRTMGNYDAAIAAYRMAVELDPQNAQAHGGLGYTLRIAGDYAGAVAAYHRVIELEPGNAYHHQGLGDSLMATGDLRGAIEMYRKSIDLDPEHASVHVDLGRACEQGGDLEAALAAGRRAVELDPKLLRAQVYLGRFLMSAWDYAGAAGRFRQAIRLDPTSDWAYVNLAIALRKMGDLEAALVAARKSLELHPEYTDARNEVKTLERQLPLKPALQRLVAGEAVDVTAAQRAALAWMLYDQRRWDLSVRMSVLAFSEDPSLAADLGAGHRYNAACAAALAGEKWHVQCLEWLHAHLEAYSEQLETDPAAATKSLLHWKKDRDLMSIREAPEFRKLWADVDALLARAKEATK